MRALVVTVMAAFGVACGAARAPITTFEALPSRVANGKTVVVDDVTGQRHRGRLVRLGPDFMAFADDGVERTLASADIRRVFACCDSLANGAAIGFGLGLAGGLATGGQWIEFGMSLGDGIGVLMLFGGVGAVVGAGIDASLRKDELVYVAPGVTVGLGGGPRRPMLGMTVTW